MSFEVLIKFCFSEFFIHIYIELQIILFVYNSAQQLPHIYDTPSLIFKNIFDN